MLLVENEIVQEASIRDKLSMFFTYSIEIIQKVVHGFLNFAFSKPNAVSFGWEQNSQLKILQLQLHVQTTLAKFL